jgi:septum formation protein
MNGSLPQMRVVLASASPRRRELLTLVGIPHEVRPADVDESLHPHEAPAVYAERLARAKAAAGRDAIDTATAGADAPRDTREVITVGSDTIVVIDDMVLGKPHDTMDAARMLELLSGRTHTVYTAVAVARGKRIASGVEHVAVTFRTLDTPTIMSYIATGEPMDKAGSYGIQGYGATLVERIDGDYFAVMGLPLGRMVELFAQLDVVYDFGKVYAVTRAGEA